MILDARNQPAVGDFELTTDEQRRGWTLHDHPLKVEIAGSNPARVTPTADRAATVMLVETAGCYWPDFAQTALPVMSRPT